MVQHLAIASPGRVVFLFLFLNKLPPHQVEKMPGEGVCVAAGGRKFLNKGEKQERPGDEAMQHPTPSTYFRGNPDILLVMAWS